MTLGWDNPTADPTTTVLLRHGDTHQEHAPRHLCGGHCRFGGDVAVTHVLLEGAAHEVAVQRGI